MTTIQHLQLLGMAERLGASRRVLDDRGDSSNITVHSFLDSNGARVRIYYSDAYIQFLLPPDGNLEIRGPEMEHSKEKITGHHVGVLLGEAYNLMSQVEDDELLTKLHDTLTQLTEQVLKSSPPVSIQR